MLVGDFNTVFDRATDHIGSVIGDTSRESSVALERLFNDACCIDIWRYLHPSSSAFTWTKSDGSISSRIDLIGCPYVWVASVSACNILPCPFSDHCAVSVTLTVPDVIPPGPGLWKLNTSLLEEEEYCRLINDFWTDWKHCKLSFPSLSKWWNAVKGKIKGIMVSYCVRRSQKNSSSRDLLARLAAHLKARLDAGCLSVLGVYRSTLEQLSAYDVKAAEGAQVQSRVRWVEEGEVSSAYFFRLEKKRSADQWVSALRNPDGSIVSTPSDLCSSFTTFYSSLFTACPTDPTAQNVLLSNVSSILSPAQADLCEGFLTLEECHRALVCMARRKAPGSDGLPVEFYLKFWDVLGPDLVEILNSCYLSGRYYVFVPTGGSHISNL